jgi:hypothetical protein
MKMMKWALLGGAAFAVMSTSAQADELTALKAQLETLQARVSQLEAQPAASMPSGFSLLSIRDGSNGTVVPERQSDRTDPDSGITLSVLPAADVAPTAEISVSGEIRTLLVYNDQGFFDGDDFLDDELDGDGDGHLDVQVRGRLVVNGKVDTAVGEVGAHIRLQGGNPFDNHDAGDLAHMNQAYGWWKFAPNWQLIAGYWDTTAAIQAGVDWDFTLGTGGPSDKNTEQMRLVYGTDGPFSLAIALEDTDDAFTAIGGGDSCADTAVGIDPGPDGILGTEDDIPFDTAFATCDDIDSETDRGKWPAIAGYIMYNNDNLMFQVAGVYQDDQFGDDQDWGVGAGARIGLGDMFTVTAAAVFAKGYNGWTNNLAVGQDDEFWAASVGLIFNLAEATRVEIGGGYEHVNAEHDQIVVFDGFSGQPFDQRLWIVTAGIYWDPVSQVTVGLQGQYNSAHREADVFVGGDPLVDGDEFEGDSDSNNNFTVRFGTWLRFP